MSDDPGLFDVPADAYLIPPAPEQLTRGEKRKRLVEKRIAQGTHPLGYVALHPDAAKFTPGTSDECVAEGLRCGDCRFRVRLSHHDKTYPKCHFPTQRGDKVTYDRDTGCESSDIRAWWPACRDFQAVRDD